MSHIINHVMRSDVILRGIVSGKPQSAWCGERFVPFSTGNGSVEKAGAPTCSYCERMKAVHDESLKAINALKDRANELGRQIQAEAALARGRVEVAA